MLGNVVRNLMGQKMPDVDNAEYKLLDFFKGNWFQKNNGRQATLKPQKETWQEFWLYASSSAKWCPRMSALQAMFGSSNEEFKPETLWLFRQGDAYHSVLQNVLSSVSSKDMKFLGAWERVVRLKIGNNIYKKEEKFGKNKIQDGERRDIVRGWRVKPRGKGWEYRESKVRMPDYRVVVKFDGVLDWGDSGQEVIEIKTEKSQYREAVDSTMGGKPRQNHIDQLLLGMWATGIKKGRLVYVFKGEWSFARSIVEYVIDYDSIRVEELKAIAKECTNSVQKVQKFLEKNRKASDKDKAAFLDKHFERLEECPMKSKGRAKNCKERQQCFNVELFGKAKR